MKDAIKPIVIRMRTQGTVSKLYYRIVQFQGGVYSVQAHIEGQWIFQATCQNISDGLDVVNRLEQSHVEAAVIRSWL